MQSARDLRPRTLISMPARHYTVYVEAAVLPPLAVQM